MCGSVPGIHGALPTVGRRELYRDRFWLGREHACRTGAGAALIFTGTNHRSKKKRKKTRRRRKREIFEDLEDTPA